jgi:hypothetical protein
MEDPVVFCGDLAEEQCMLLTDTAANMEDMTSGAYESTLDFLLTGIPEAPFDEIAVNWNQLGAYVSDPDFQAKLDAMSDEEMMAMSGDPEAAIAFAMDVFDNIDTAQQTNIMLGEETAELLSANIGYPLPTDISIRFTIVDGNGYINLDDLAAIVPEMGGMTGWIGTELRPVLEYVLENADLEASGSDDMAQIGAMAAVASPEAQLEIFGDYLDIAQTSEDPAVFVTTFDMGAFVTSPAFIEMVVSQIEATEGAPISAGDIAQAQAMLPMVAPMLFGGLDVSSVQTIDPASMYTLDYATTFEWDLSSLISMAAMTGAMPPAPAGTQTFVGFSTNTIYGEHNAIEAIEAPENAMFVPGETVVQMLDQSAQ